MKRLLGVGVLLALLLGGVAQAAIDTYEFSDADKRERYRTLIAELRCPKCQNQNLADSNAPIAMDLRQEVYQMLQQDKSDDQIVDFLVLRYGDFVRYKPPLDARTLVLWFGPAALLLAGLGGLLVLVLRRRRVNSTSAAATRLTDEERERLTHLLDKKDP